MGAAFFCIINSRSDSAIDYQNTVIRSDVIRTLGITPTVAEGRIWASGIIYDQINQVTGAEISLGAVALDSAMLTEISGAQTDGGFTISRTNDIEKEFAFGYWGENRDGTKTFFWHPVCKLTPGEESKETRNDDVPNPEKSYTITVIPFGHILTVKYDQGQAMEAGHKPLEVNSFFQRPLCSIDDVKLLTQQSTGTGGYTDEV